jgi:hypothetical protein
MEKAFSQMESDRQLIIGDLLTVATSISHAPAKPSFFNLKYSGEGISLYIP